MSETCGVPLLPSVLSRIRLSTLELTSPGDVFYLVSDPSAVWQRDCPMGGEEYAFLQPGDERWYRMEDVGGGTPGQRVVILHNARQRGVR